MSCFLQLDLLNQKQSSAAGITLAPVTPAARRGGQSSIRTKWKEAFRNLTQSDKQSTTKEKSSKATTQREQELLEKYSRVVMAPPDSTIRVQSLQHDVHMTVLVYLHSRTVST